jgi:hypothetical protein
MNLTHIIVFEMHAQDRPAELPYIRYDEATDRRSQHLGAARIRGTHLDPSSVHWMKCADFGSLIILFYDVNPDPNVDAIAYEVHQMAEGNALLPSFRCVAKWCGPSYIPSRE